MESLFRWWSTVRLLVLLFVECGFLLHVPLWQCTYVVCSKVNT